MRCCAPCAGPSIATPLRNGQAKTAGVRFDVAEFRFQGQQKSFPPGSSRIEENLVFQTRVETTSLVLCLLSSLGKGCWARSNGPGRGLEKDKAAPEPLGNGRNNLNIIPSPTAKLMTMNLEVVEFFELYQLGTSSRKHGCLHSPRERGGLCSISLQHWPRRAHGLAERF